MKGEFHRRVFQGKRLLLTGNDSQEFGKVDYQNISTFPRNAFRFNGSLHAVYDFLEECCGCRFYFIDDASTIFKRTASLCVKEDNRDFTPTFDAHREIWLSNREKLDELYHFTPRQIELWRLRWRLTQNFGHANHNQYSLWFKYWDKAKNPNLSKAFVEKKPSLFAQGYEGQGVGADGILTSNYVNDRNLPAQPCYTNPETIEHYAQEAVRYLHGKNVIGGWGNMSGNVSTEQCIIPRMEGMPWFYPIEGGDNARYCKCPECQKLSKSLNAYEEQNHSNLKFAFIAKIAQRAAEIDKDAGISTLAYITNLSYPDKVELPLNLAVGICLTNYTWYHPVVREKQMAEYKKWIEKEARRRPLVLWTYIFSSFWDASIHFKYKPLPCYYPWQIGEQFKMFGKDGIRGWFTCIELHYNTLEGYLAARLCYDNSLNPEEVIDEYFTNCYGKAGSVMQQFYKDIEEMFWNPANYPKEWSQNKSTVVGPTGNKHPFWATGLQSPEINWSIGTPERMKHLDALITEAESLVETPQEKMFLQRLVDSMWKPAREGFDEFQQRERIKGLKLNRLTCQYQKAPEAGNPESINWNDVPCWDKWTDIEAHDVKSACSVAAVADDKYLYLKLEDKDAADPIINVWGDNFEVFFSEGGTRPILQIAIDREGNSVIYRHVVENDVYKRTQVQIPLAVTTVNKAKYFSVTMAIPRKELPPQSGSAHYCNFMRTSGIKGNQVWNPTFTPRYLDGMRCCGLMHIFPMKIKPYQLKMENGCSGLAEDQLGGCNEAGWMLGAKGWTMVWVIPEGFPEGDYEISATVRSDAPADPKLRHIFCVYDFQNRKGQNSPAITLDQFAGAEYKDIDLGTYRLKSGLSLIIGGLNDKTIPGENRVWLKEYTVIPVQK